MLQIPTKFNQTELTKLAHRRGLLGERMVLRVRLSSPSGPRWCRVSAKFVDLVGGSEDNLTFRFRGSRISMNAPEDVRKGLGLSRPRISLWRPTLLTVPAASVRFVNPSDTMRTFLKVFGLQNLIWKKRSPRKSMSEFFGLTTVDIPSRKKEDQSEDNAESRPDTDSSMGP